VDKGFLISDTDSSIPSDIHDCKFNFQTLSTLMEVGGYTICSSSCQLILLAKLNRYQPLMKSLVRIIVCGLELSLMNFLYHTLIMNYVVSFFIVCLMFGLACGN